MTNASSTTCVSGCTGVTNYAWLLEVIFEVEFRCVIGCGPPLISLLSSLVDNLADVMSVSDEGVVSISITIASKIWLEQSMIPLANERVSAEAPRSFAHEALGALLDSSEALSSLEARSSVLDRLRSTESQPLIAHTSSLKTISSSPSKDTETIVTIIYPSRPGAKNVDVPKWEVTNDFRMDGLWDCRNFNDNLACMNFGLCLRFEYEMDQREKLEKNLLKKEEEVQRKDGEISSLKLRMEKVESNVVDVHVDEKIAKLEDHLAALDAEFDIELFPNMLKVVAAKRWVSGHGVGVGVAHGNAGRGLEDIDSYCAEAKGKYKVVVKYLDNGPFPLLVSLGSCKDSANEFLMASLTLEGSHEGGPQTTNPYGRDIPLHEALAASQAKASSKKGSDLCPRRGRSLDLRRENTSESLPPIRASLYSLKLFLVDLLSYKRQELVVMLVTELTDHFIGHEPRWVSLSVIEDHEIECTLRHAVGVKSLLDAVWITAAHVFVNAAQLELVLLRDFKENMLSVYYC
ncbi:hypothetical protein Tco_0084907 [Tanacetum coccineum]